MSSVRLLPGLHAVRRDDAHVQVGVDPPARAVLPSSPGVLSLLDALEAGSEPPRDADALASLLILRAAGLVEVDPGPTCSPVAAAADRVASVVLVERGLSLAPLRPLLERAGLATPTGRQGRPDLCVVGSAGLLSRETVDPWVAEDVPHLVLGGTGTPRSLRLGPFVQPGVTACLRCVDAHEATLDPRRPLVLEQLAAFPPAPVDPLVLGLALSWAARELVTFASGGRPATWSATVDLHAGVPGVRPWERHPWCGCGWDDLPY